MDEKKITCIVCPIGCKISIKTDGTQFEVKDGNKCNKGIEYARNETLDPRRILTTLILVKGGEWPLVSVKSTQSIPKDRLFPILKEIKQIIIDAPVISGQIIIKNVLNTGIDIVATKTIKVLKQQEDLSTL
jgi:CxxC motif-containing protein